MYGNHQSQSQHQSYPPNQPYNQQQEPYHQHPVNSSGFCCDCQSYTMTSQWYRHHGGGGGGVVGRHGAAGGGVLGGPGVGVGGGVGAAPSYNYLMDTPASNSREQRNKAEKQRRDKLNSFITELACLVPMVFNSPKRMDKTSILRLSATHLRIYQTLNGGISPKLDVPKNVDQNIIENLVCDELNGFLLILTATGKIVFVSQTVETLLGHLQTDLMGQTIFSITAPEDHDRLKVYITQSDHDPSSSSTGSNNNHSTSYHNNHHNNMMSDRDWRKYFNIRLKRAGPRSEPPVYESVNVMGMQRPSASAGGQQHAGSGASENGGQQQGAQMSTGSSNDMWIFFVRLNRPEAVTNMLMEASKDEYVTRHYVDGRIIDCDQRISLIAGYMIEEINGLSAFNFMHKEDVHWVIVALRQMYDRGESRGNSCYRLQSKTGQFIYLRTFGFLEADSTGTVETFICVNSLVSEREGLQLIREMKERYSALVNPGSSSPLTITELDNNGVETVEDPQTIEVAIENLLHNLPTEADLTYQELTGSNEKTVKTEPAEYVNYNAIGYSSNGDAAHGQQGVKRSATGKSPYNNSAKHRKVTKLLMRPTSTNPSSQSQARTPTPLLSPSPTVPPSSRQQPSPVFIKQEDPPSPLSVHSTYVPSPCSTIEPQSPLMQSHIHQQQQSAFPSLLPPQSPVTEYVQVVNMGASPGTVSAVASLSPGGIGQSVGIIMPPTPLTPSMDHSYPYRPQISPGSNHIQQQQQHHYHTSRNLLSPPMSDCSRTSAQSPLQPSTTTTYTTEPPQDAGTTQIQEIRNTLIDQPVAIAELGELEELNRAGRYNGDGAGMDLKTVDEVISGRGDVR